ncbi:MAG TPA: hypothetical protein PKD85_00365 [Saprospiraceae bacterium]|nr:hypothetical protein [Saprospiraceae bacterium]
MGDKWIYIVCLLLLYGCLEDENQVNYAIIEKKLKKDLEEYKKLKWYDCYNTIVLDAEAYVDTVLLVETLNASLQDGLIFPIRPHKPQYIGAIRLDDSTQKQPIFDLLQLKRKHIEDRDTIKQEVNEMN